MTTSAFRLSLTLLVFAVAAAGCKPLAMDSSMKNKITKEPDASFLKRVKNDPFPAAGQAPKNQTAASTAPSRTNNAKPLAAQPTGTKPNASATTATASDTDETTETTATASRPTQPVRRR